jgi:DNA-binding NarL/FixJ family response regulator
MRNPKTTSSPTRILVADPLPTFRLGVRKVLVQAGFDVIEASDLAGLSDAVCGAAPDLALVDLDLPPTGAIGAIEHMTDACGAPAIVWSSSAWGETVVAAIRAGAVGFLPKEISPGSLVRTLRGVARGEAALSRQLTALLIGSLQRSTKRTQSRTKGEALSAREREVLSLVAEGARNKQVARSLVISEFTVKRHVQNILRKLELPSRSEAASFYRTALDLSEPDRSALSSA